MSLIAELRDRVEHLAVFAELDVASAGLPESALRAHVAESKLRHLVAGGFDMACDPLNLLGGSRFRLWRGPTGMSVAGGSMFTCQ